MRRGLIARSPVELPDAVFDARLDRVRAAMRQARLDALVVYTNNTRPAARVLARGLCPVLVGSAVGPAARRRALSRRGAEFSRQILDRAGEPAGRRAAYAAHRAQGGAADRGRAAGCRRWRGRFRRPCRRHRRRFARGRPWPRVARRECAVRDAPRQRRSGGDRAGSESRRDCPSRTLPRLAAIRSTP